MAEHAAAPMTLTFLGTASAYPSPKRGTSSMAIRHNQDVWLFDCGEGTQIKLMASQLRPGKISKIFITHLHGDHSFGLPGLLCTMGQSNQRTEPVDIYGPLGLAKYLRVTLGLTRSLLNFKYRVFELVPTSDMYADNDNALCNVEPDDLSLSNCQELQGNLIYPDKNSVWALGTDGAVSFSAGPVVHRVPSFSYVVHEADTTVAGKLDIKKLASFGVKPGPICSELKSGRSITLENGTIIYPRDVCGPYSILRGRKVVIGGDSCDSSKISKIAQNADIYVHEATVENNMREIAIERGHSTPKMAAEYAILAGAKMLWLTHFSQRYRPAETDDDDPSKPRTSLLLAEAKEAFGDNVCIASDLLTIDIPSIISPLN